MSVLLADIDATCAALGYSDGQRYQAEPDAAEGLKHLIWILRRDLDNHEYRRHLGRAKVLETDLVYMLPDYVQHEELSDLLIRLLVILTNPTLLLYREGPPNDNHGRKVFMELIDILQGYKSAFAKDKIWSALFDKLKQALEIVSTTTVVQQSRLNTNQFEMALIFDEQGVNRGYSSDDSDGDESTHGYYTCVVCMCTAVCPRVSFCGHLFCSRCIEAWMQAQGPIVKCPYCKSRIAEKTLITVQPFSNYRQRGAAPYRRCKSLQEHRQKMLQDNEYIETPVNLPQASMFLHGEIELPPGLLPRSKPLAPQLLRQVKEQPPVQRTFVDYSWHQRGITLFIMVFLFALLNSTRDLK